MTILKRENITIPQIFKERGESYFRKLEFKYLSECINQFDIISTGGGIIENSASLDLLKIRNKSYG